MSRGSRANNTPRRAAPVQNSPCSPALGACPVQNSPCSPEMAQYGAIYACRESFVPFSPPRTQAGRTLYRTPGRNGASHNSTPRTTGTKGTRGTTGPRRGRAGGWLAGPARVGRAIASQIPHIISPGHFLRPPENVAIPTTQIQYLNKLLGNYVRNC